MAGNIAIELSESNINIANNTSDVTASVVYYGNGVSWNNDQCPISLTLDGTSYSGSSTFSSDTSKQVLMTKTKTVSHSADGSKTVSADASFVTGVSLGTLTASATLKLTKIARYATVSQSSTSRTETSITMKWTSDATVDYIWWSSNNGGTWHGINVTDGKSGSYTISNLSAGTNYKIRTRVRRKDSQLTTDSSALSVTTFAYPYANSMPDFTIGNSVTVGLYNPLKRSVTVEMQDSDGHAIGSYTTSGTSYKGWSTTAIVNALYASIPNSKSGTYRIKVTYGSHHTTKTGGTYSVNTTASKPTLGAVAYQDTNSTVVAITQNDQNIVRNKSTVSYTASNLTAKNSATISSCKVEVNGTTYNLTKSGSSYVGGNAVINSGTDVTAKFTVTDSRGLTASKSVTVKMLDWVSPTALITIERRNNFYSETDITADANYSSVDNKNAVEISYRAKVKGATEWTVSGTLDDNVPSTVTVDNTQAWTFEITITDLFGGRRVYTVNVARGMPVIFVDRIRESFSVNKFPSHDQSFEVGGDAYIDGELTVKNHDTPIGWYEGHNDTTSIASGSSYAIVSGSSINLTQGRYVITASASFEGNVNGYRGINFKSGTSNIVEGSTIHTAIPSTSWATRVGATIIRNVTSAGETISLGLVQNSGTALNTTWFIKAIRIQ